MVVIDFDRYIPTILSSLVAKLRANANVFFAKTYGVSLAEWRILTFLREHGPASAYDIWSKSTLDKALVSRETNALSKKKLVRIVPVKGNSRNRSEIELSKAGAELLDNSLDDILRRHDNLTAGLDTNSIETFLRVIHHLESRIAHMGDEGAQPLSLLAPVKHLGKRSKHGLAGRSKTPSSRT